MHRRTDSHRDYRSSAHLRMVDFFFHCEAHQDVFNTHLLLLKHKNKQTNRTNLTTKFIEIAIFKFTDLIRFRIIDQLTAFFSLSDKTEVLPLYGLSCWCDGNHEHRNHRHVTFMSNRYVFNVECY